MKQRLVLTFFAAALAFSAAPSAPSAAAELPTELADAMKGRDYAKVLAAGAGAKLSGSALADVKALAAAKASAIAGAAAGKRPSVSMDFMGRPMRGKVKAADAEGITVNLGGMTRKFKWGELSDRRFYSVVRRFGDDTPAGHLALARVCVALGLAEGAEKELISAGSSEGARELRARLAALKPAAEIPKRPAGGGRGTAGAVKPKAAARDDEFKNVWVHAGRTSAVIYWQRKDIATDALSYVEYGETDALGSKTAKTKTRRWSQFHRITGLKRGATYHYRMVLVDGDKETASGPKTFQTKAYDGATEIKATTGTVRLDRAGATYILTGDVTASGTGIEIAAANVTLEMDGRKVRFAEGGRSRCHGILISAPGAKIYNGVVEQGKPGAAKCYALGSFGRAVKTEAAGLTLSVHYNGSYPVALINKASELDLHHNYCYSEVTRLKSRHYPGNDLLRVDPGGPVKIHNNLLVKGCHRGMAFHSGKGSVEVYENEIAHDQGYTNGYAINCTDNMKIHHNRIVSCGRGMHVTASNIEIYENWMSTTQHQVYDDRPQGSTNYRHYYTENHGIKLESPGRNVRIHHNYVQSTQPQPEPGAPQRFSNTIKGRITENSGMKGDRDHYSPATPLNFHSGKSSDVEIFENTFVAITTYRSSKQASSYYKPGEWAATIRVAGAFGGKLHIHDNVFKSNDIFINARELSSGVKIEKNKFILLPGGPSNHRAVNGSGAARKALRSGGNTFEGQQP